MGWQRTVAISAYAGVLLLAGTKIDGWNYLNGEALPQLPVTHQATPRIAGLLFGRQPRRPPSREGTDVRAFRFLYEGRYMSYAREQQGRATRDSPRDPRR